MTQFNANVEKHKRTIAQYLAVQHMPHAQAAAAMGKNVETVRHYRRCHPEVAHVPDAVPVVEAKPAPRYNTVTVHIPLAEPSRSSAVSSVPTMRVSLPAPPWGGSFEREGVKA